MSKLVDVFLRRRCFRDSRLRLYESGYFETAYFLPRQEDN